MIDPTLLCQFSTKGIRMRFRVILQRCTTAVLMMAAATVFTGCACEPATPIAKADSHPSENAGLAIGDSLRIQEAVDRMNRGNYPGVISTRDDDGLFFASALRIVDVLDQEKRLPSHLLGQILWLGELKGNDLFDVTIYADGFEEIEMLYWHDGLLHVMHGPNYSTVVGIPGQPASARRDDRSKIISAKTCATSQGKKEMESLQVMLADRTKSNDLRIEALWKLRDLTNDRSANDSYSGSTRKPAATPAELDPTRSFITAMHNGPEPLRAEAARALRMRTVNTQPAIKGLIHRAKNDNSAKVRMEAALTLGYLKAKDAAGDLLGSLDDPDDVARIAKVLAIRMINDWELAPAFINAASERTREGALLALKDVQEAGAIAALDFAVRASPYAEIRLQAVMLLERAAYAVLVDDNAIHGKVSELSLDTEPPRALPQAPPGGFVIPMWDAKTCQSPHLPQIIEAVRVAANDEDASVRNAAAACLLKLDSPKASK